MAALTARPNAGLVLPESQAVLQISPQQFLAVLGALSSNLVKPSSTETPPGCPEAMPDALEIPGVLICFDETVRGRSLLCLLIHNNL